MNRRNFNSVNILQYLCRSFLKKNHSGFRLYEELSPEGMYCISFNQFQLLTIGVGEMDKLIFVIHLHNIFFNSKITSVSMQLKQNINDNYI